MRAGMIINLLVLCSIFLIPNCYAQKDSSGGLTRIMKQGFNRLINDGYKFFYKLSDGQSREEEATFGDDKKNLKVKGSYSYVGDNNKMYNVKYTADENGYKAKTEVVEMPIVVQKPKIVDLSPAAIATLASG